MYLFKSSTLYSGFLFIVIVLAGGLSACSSSDKKAVYEGAKAAKPLEAPPDLIVPKVNADEVPVIASPEATYSGYQSSKDDEGVKVLEPLPKGIRLVRDGAMRWLEIENPIQQVWKSGKQFLTDTGFELTVVDKRLGIIETNWLENRADVPSNWASRLLRKLYSSGLLDKYRIRIELDENNKVLVFITHRGLREVVSGDQPDAAVTEGWTWREPDPQLEMEMLQRFALYLGLDEKTAQRAVPVGKVSGSRTQLKEEEGKVWLEVEENFPRTWRRTSLALDRMGLIVEDKDRSSGKYYIRVPEDYQEDDKGWLASLFSSEGEKKDAFVISLLDQGNATRIEVLDKESRPESGPLSKRLLSEFAKLLR